MTMSRNIMYRLLEPEDFWSAVSLCFQEIGSSKQNVLEDFSTWFNHAQRAVFTVGVACDEGKVVGTVALVRPSFTGLSRAVTHLVVHPDYRKQGIGSALVQFIEQVALERYLGKEEEAWLITDARAASEGLFRKLGFGGDTPLFDGHVILTKRIK